MSGRRIISRIAPAPPTMWLPPSAIPARLAPDVWSRHLAGRLGASLLAALTLAAVPQILPAVARWSDAACLLRGLTGIPCPGCGITTSLLALARGDAQASWTANPAGFGIAALLIGQAMLAGLAMQRGLAADAGLRWLTWLDRIAISGLAVAWVGRLAGTLS